MTRSRKAVYGLFGLWFLGIAAAALWWQPGHDSGRVVARHDSADGGAVELLSPAYQLDRVYMSMQGPRSNQPKIRLVPDESPDTVLWLTSVASNVVDAETLEPVSNEFFCHSNLTFNPDTTTPQLHNVSFEKPLHADWRLFTLVPGRMDNTLPEGFGLPVKNQTLLDYFTMVLNQNEDEPERSIRLHTKLTYRRQGDGAEPMKPLFRRALYVYQQHTEDPKATEVADASNPEHLGEFCAENCQQDQRGATPSEFGTALDLHPGATCCVGNASADGVVPQFGEENTVHWMVPPGNHEYRTEVTEQMQLPFDTTAHYITGHLHPFGKSLRLVDMETGEVVFDVKSRSFDDRLGVEWMSEIKSPEGINLVKGRRYELVAEYDNTLDHEIDAMGIMYVYALEQQAF